MSGCTTFKGAYPYQSTKPSKKYPSDNLDNTPSGLRKKNGEPVASMRPYTVFGKEYYPTVVSVLEILQEDVQVGMVVIFMVNQPPMVRDMICML